MTRRPEKHLQYFKYTLYVFEISDTQQNSKSSETISVCILGPIAITECHFRAHSSVVSVVVLSLLFNLSLEDIFSAQVGAQFLKNNEVIGSNKVSESPKALAMEHWHTFCHGSWR
jgi:hypothetical protein